MLLSRSCSSDSTNSRAWLLAKSTSGPGTWPWHPSSFETQFLGPSRDPLIVPGNSNIGPGKMDRSNSFADSKAAFNPRSDQTGLHNPNQMLDTMIGLRQIDPRTNHSGLTNPHSDQNQSNLRDQLYNWEQSKLLNPSQMLYPRLDSRNPESSNNRSGHFFTLNYIKTC